MDETPDGASVEARLRLLEDRMEIMQLIAGYGPAVDSLSGPATAALWTEGGRYDYGGPPLAGTSAIAGLVDLPTHTAYVARGCAHVLGLPLVSVEGDRATATNYSQVFLHDGERWQVERTGANRWELVRTPAGWRVESRVNRLLDGQPEARALLAAGLADQAAAP